MPKKPDAPRKPRGGTDTLRERGLVQLVLTLTAEERCWIHAASAMAGLPASQWLRRLGVEAATEAMGRPPA